MAAEKAADNTTTIQTEDKLLCVNNSQDDTNIDDPEIQPESTSKPPEAAQNTDDYDDSISIKTDESQRTKSEEVGDKTIIDGLETQATTTQLKDGGDTDNHNPSQSFGRAISNTVRYKIPRSISRTHLKDTIQCGYLCIWSLAIILSSTVIVFDWAIVKAFNITLCDIENNTDGDQVHVDFMSWNAFAGFIQQLWLIIICLGGFSLFYLPNLVGITEEEDDSKRIRYSRIKLFGVMILTQLIVQLFLVPVRYNFRSIFNALILFFFLLWAYYEKRCPGVRAMFPLWAVIFAAVFLYYVLGGYLFKSMSNRLYAAIYPFFLTFCQGALIRMLEYLDGCQCCRPGIHNEMDPEHKEGSCRRTCMKRLEFWKRTAAINSWPGFWVYYACGLVVVMSESFRIASYVVIKENGRDLATSFVLGMGSEVISRNMIYKIIWDKYIMRRKDSSPLSKVRAIYLGCKYHTDYIPVLILVASNILGFGHTNDCYYSKIPFSMDITNGYEWMIGVFVAYEMFTDCATYAAYRLLKKFGVLTRDAQDKTIKMAIVMLTPQQMFPMMLSLGYWSFVAYIYDDSARPQEV